MENSKEEQIDYELENTYKISDTYLMLLDRKLGHGSFGQIYECLNMKTKEIFASKIESLDTISPQLFHESKILNIMKGFTGFPSSYALLNSSQDKILIMEYLGANLETIMNRLPSKKFTLKSTLMIGIQVLDRLRDLHERGIIHRDMKPENLVIGKGNHNKIRLIYLIDFGLSKMYINEKKVHIGLKTERSILGTVRYISINMHQRLEQSRRDDLESLMYVLIYFIKGELPWQGIKAKSKKEKYDKIYEIKKHSVPYELCKFLPEEFIELVNYTINLGFEEKPNYVKMKNTLEQVMTKFGYCNDFIFDWISPDFLKALYDRKNLDTSANNINEGGEESGDIDKKKSSSNFLEEGIEDKNSDEKKLIENKIILNNKKNYKNVIIIHKTKNKIEDSTNNINININNLINSKDNIDKKFNNTKNNIVIKKKNLISSINMNFMTPNRNQNLLNADKYIINANTYTNNNILKNKASSMNKNKLNKKTKDYNKLNIKMNSYNNNNINNCGISYLNKNNESYKQEEINFCNPNSSAIKVKKIEENKLKGPSLSNDYFQVFSKNNRNIRNDRSCEKNGVNPGGGISYRNINVKINGDNNKNNFLNYNKNRDLYGNINFKKSAFI